MSKSGRAALSVLLSAVVGVIANLLTSTVAVAPRFQLPLLAALLTAVVLLT